MDTTERVCIAVLLIALAITHFVQGWQIGELRDRIATLEQKR